MDEDAVNITRHKKILEGIRNGNEQPGSGVSLGHAQGGDNLDRQDEGRTVEGDTGVGERAQGTGQSNGAAQGLREGVRQTKQPNEHPTPRPSRRRRTTETVEEKPAPTRLRLPFLEKSVPKKAPVKLFTIEEAEAEQERMAEIYDKLFKFGDDILEIIVRDHEPVEIWAITEEQADTLARNHLNQARTNVEAARSARKLLEIYDRLYFYSVIIPRVVKTSNHIAEHKGVSFK